MRLGKLFLLCFMLITSSVMGQVDERGQDDFNKAIAYKVALKHELAAEKMQEAIKANPSYTQAYSILGEWYMQARNYPAAVKVFASASNATRNGQSAFAKPLATAYLYSYEPAKALQLLDTYVPAKKNADWKKLQAQATFMLAALNRKWMVSPKNMGHHVNTRYAETHPYISSDSMTLYFTRKVNGVDEDFYRTTVDTCGGWFYARNMGSPPNTLSHETAQMISADGHYLFFSRSDGRSENGWDRGGSDLFMAYAIDSVWSIPQSFGGTINSPAYESSPCLSADNRELYFVSNKPGGFGGLDIWVSRFENGLWQDPRNMGPDINTPGDETAPFLHTDNTTLYYCSNGLVGFGGKDIFYTKRIKDTIWTKPENIGFPINSTADENSISVTTDGSKAYFSSDRDSVAGNYDIYETEMPFQIQPVPVAILKGYTFDSLTKERLNYSSIYIKDTNGNALFHYTSNRGDGSYLITLPVGHNYTYNADRIGYSDITGTIALADKRAMTAMEYNIPLLPQGYQAPISDSSIITIFFPKNSASLRDTDKAQILAALTPWLDEKGIMITVNGYTDNTGTPIINEQLSYQRAGLVANEILSLGIDELSLKSQGWGEAEPVATNDTDEGRGLNRRVEVIIRR